MKLPRVVVLNGTWECSIAEVRYPLTFFNVSEDMSLSKVYDGTPHKQSLLFQPGFYSTNEVISQINAFIGAWGN